MSTIATSPTRTAERLSRWSLAGNTCARPDSGPQRHSTPHASPKRIVNGAQSKPIAQTRSHHLILMPSRIPPNHIAPINSP
jgi:hypothetical protein